MVIAKFSGVCPDCKLPIRIGDKLGKHNGRWAHIQCPPRQQPRFEDPMARFDLEIQQREIDLDQAAFEKKLEDEAFERDESRAMGVDTRPSETLDAPCGAPASIRPWQRTTVRCGKPLGLLESLHPQFATREIGRRCPDGHFSFQCQKCRAVTFAVTSAPPAEHETICSTYCCRACGNPVWSDEGIDGHLGEVR